MRMNERQQLIALVTVFSLVVIAEGFFAYSCLSERSKVNQDLTRLQKEATEAQRKKDQIPKLREKSAELAQIIEDYAHILPTEREVSNEQFLEDIEGFMEDTGLALITGAPVIDKRKSKAKDGAARSKFDQHKYKFTLEGPFLGFLKFVNRVENHTRFLEVIDFNIRPGGASNRGAASAADEINVAENPRKSIDVIISTYTYSKPKEVAKAK